ncbi:MAG TPA: hypothetical protein VGM84_00770 [Steroidobacteraceae bacterium]|jgi:chromosome segregation ATPase
MKVIRSFLISLLALGLGGLVQAQTARTGGAPNAQLMQQMQQLAAERTGLQAENAKMKKELDDLRKERDALKKTQQQQVALDGKLKAGSEALARSEAARESANQELTQTKGRLEELVNKFRETVQSMREIETNLTTTRQESASRQQDLKVCTLHNQALYKLNGEILTRLEHPSGWSRVASAEPFTRIKRVELENLVDDFKGRADDERLPTTPAAPLGNPK